MYWSDILAILFAAVAMNHLGLISAVETVIRHSLPILNCVKCCTFWVVLAYMVIMTRDIIISLALSLFCAWLALWVELGMASIDKLYMKIYEKIITDTDDDTTATDADNGNSPGTVPELQQNCKNDI